MTNKTDKAVGRYIYLDVDGVEYRVYYEESGTGIPLLLQHTAGADGRQWRHLLEDDEITSNFRVISYDLPFHGKSLPPQSTSWWEQEYGLDENFFRKFVVTLGEALGAERPVYMGSSMGGDLAPDLALNYPGHFRAVIGVEAALVTPGYYLDLYYHPEVGNQAKQSTMYSLTAPTAPENNRRETCWVYSQGSPAVFKGDLLYYSVQYDLTETAKNIDTSSTAVYIMNGEYDFTSAFEEAEELAAQIPGAKAINMAGLGHFPMSEDPEQFMSYLKPVLREITAASEAASHSPDLAAAR